MLNMYKLIKKPFFGRFMVSWKNPLTANEQKEWEKVKTTSKSGGIIHGLYATAHAHKAKATIVLGHPMGKEAKGYFIKNGYTNLLRENGYNVLVFDINGFGESTHGNFSYFEDIIAISILAKSLTPELPIGYHGISLSGQCAAVAFTDIEHRYDFAIIESAATTLEEFWFRFPAAYRALRIMYFLMPVYRQKINMIERIKEARKLQSILFIYSQTDTWTPVSMGERFRQNCNVQSELWTVQDAPHAMMMKSKHRQAYQQKILDYFNRNAD